MEIVKTVEIKFNSASFNYGAEKLEKEVLDAFKEFFGWYAFGIQDMSIDEEKGEITLTFENEGKFIEEELVAFCRLLEAFFWRGVHCCKKVDKK